MAGQVVFALVLHFGDKEVPDECIGGGRELAEGVEELVLEEDGVAAMLITSHHTFDCFIGADVLELEHGEISIAYGFLIVYQSCIVLLVHQSPLLIYYIANQRIYFHFLIFSSSL